MVVKTKPTYEVNSQPLVRTSVPEIFTLVYDDLGKEAIAKVNEKFKGNRYIEFSSNMLTRDKPIFSSNMLTRDKPIAYSNPFRRYALGEAVKEITGWNVRPITPAESEIGLKANLETDGDYGLPGNPREYYEDLALILYQNKGPNEDLRQHLLKQFQAEKVELPAVITGSLRVIPDENFQYGAKFDLQEESLVYHTPILKQRGNFDENDQELVKTGLPSKLGKGSRKLWTRDKNDGLSLLYRDGGLGLDGDGDDLGDSDETGRVNVVKVAEGDLENLEGLLKNLQINYETEKQRVSEELERRYQNAVRVLSGEINLK